MNNEQGWLKKNADAIISSLLAVGLTFSMNSYFKDASAKLALSSAYILVPKVNISYVTEAKKENAEHNKTFEAGDIQIADNTVNETAVASSDTYKTPQDIINLANAYRLEFEKAEHDGKIIEKTYDAKSATSTFKNIAVRNTTPSHSINIEKSLNKKVAMNITDKSKPTVLIFHTHTTESFQMINNGWYTNSYPERHDDKAQNMVRIGTAMCEELERNGIGVIHDTQIYDHKYTGAYDLSRKTVEKILKENPSIQIVLDVHRDSIQLNDGTRIKPTFTFNGKKAAQIMIIAGCEDGKVKDFPNWEQNLTFALQLHQKLETMYPQIMRPILFSARKYNMDVVPCSVLLEFGSDANTLEEAEYSGHLAGMALAEYIKENSGG